MAGYGGIDLGGTKIQTAVVDEHRNVLGSARRPTPTRGGPADVAGEMEGALRDAASDAGIDPSTLEGVGVGSPGTIEGGTVTSARNLPDWEGSFPLGPTLEQVLGCPVSLGNDVQVATDAEFELGAGKPYHSLLGVFWGTGVGGGLVLDGKPWVGRGAAGEIGHIVIELGGARCTCGRRGCMEAYAGRSAMEAHVAKQVEKGKQTDLFKLMKERGRTRLTSGIWARALEHGDKLAEHMIERALRRARRGRRVGLQRARRRMRDHRRRARRALGRALCRAHRSGDAAAPVRRLPPARRPRRGAWRSRRRDRRDAAARSGPRRGSGLLIGVAAPRSRRS